MDVKAPYPLRRRVLKGMIGAVLGVKGSEALAADPIFTPFFIAKVWAAKKAAAAKAAAAKSAAAEKAATTAKATGAVAAFGLSLTALADSRSYRDRTTGRGNDHHGRTAPGIEVVPELRGRLPLPGGGFLECPDGQIVTVPPGRQAPDKDSDVAASELCASLHHAPFAQGPRTLPRDWGDAKRRLDLMHRYFLVPMSELRFVRTMADATAKQYLLVSAYGPNREVEYLALWDTRAKLPTVVATFTATAWMLRGAGDRA